MECVERNPTSKVQYPPNLGGSLIWQPFIHITWTTQRLGIIDDVFVETYLNQTADPIYAVVNV